MGFQTFEDLEVWKKSRDLRIFVKKLTQKFPSEEKFVLARQVIRSSRSITNNIAEGYGRFYYQENIQFCRIARGSLEETLDQMIIAHDEAYISTQDLSEFRSLHGDCLKMLNGYISYLVKVKAGFFPTK